MNDRWITRTSGQFDEDDVFEVTDRDGTRRDVEHPFVQVQYPATYPLGPEEGGSPIDALTAAQFGLFQVVGALSIRSVDRTTFLTTGTLEHRVVGWEKVYFDWPDPGPNDELVVPSATIRLLDDAVYEYEFLDVAVRRG